jgi:hypothetical protein
MMTTIAMHELAQVSGGNLESSHRPTIFNPQGPRPTWPKEERPQLPPTTPQIPGGKYPPGWLDLPRRNDIA